MSAMAGDRPVPGPGRAGSDAALGPGIRLDRVPAEGRVEAAVRLVGDQTDDPYPAAHRFLESAEDLGIDLGLMWATVGPEGQARQVVLAVPGTGGTAMLFVSGPARRRRGSIASVADLGAGPTPTRERVALLRSACAWVSRAEHEGGACTLAQSLLETRETEAIVAFRAAGFTQLGDLAYMRRIGGAPGAADRPLPDGVRIASVSRLRAEGHGVDEIDAWLRRALAESYEETLDCPELCGLRNVEDVLESHRAVGRFDPSWWWVVFDGASAEGCVLMSVCPEHDSVELVYLGLSKRLRGRGLGSTLLNLGLRQVLGADPAEAAGGLAGAPARRVVGAGGVTCAVDTRNTAAIRLYRAAGFQRFAVRVPMVLGLGREEGHP